MMKIFFSIMLCASALSGCMTYLHDKFSPSLHPDFKIGSVPQDFGRDWQKAGYSPQQIREFAAFNCKHGMIINGLDGKPNPETVQMLTHVKNCMLANGFKLFN